MQQEENHCMMTRLQTQSFHPAACDFATTLIVASLPFAYLPKHLRCMLISCFISFWCVAGACQWLPEFLLQSAFILLKYLCRIIQHQSMTWFHLNPTMWKDLQKALNALYKKGVSVWWLQVDGWGIFLLQTAYGREFKSGFASICIHQATYAYD